MTIYVDGACSSNGSATAVGGFGVIVLDDNENYITAYKSKSIGTTNNIQELSALLYAFKLAEKDKNNVYNIYSDSIYAINCFSVWANTWSQRNWTKSDNSPVLNLNIIKEGYSIYQNASNIILHHIKGHNNIVYNELADSLASNNYKKYLTLCKKHNIPIQEDLIWE